MSQSNPAPEPDFAAFIAIDWADREHAWALQVVGESRREQGKLKHTPEAIEAWALQWALRFPGRPVAIALEQSRGALLYALTRYQHLVLYPIHPLTSHAYRAAMFPSGSKSDPVDADLLLDLLLRHRDRLRVLRPDSTETRKLQILVEKRRQLVDERTAQTNRITDLLKVYFPQALSWLDRVDSRLAAAFLRRWPTLQDLQNEKPEQVRKFFFAHGSRSKTRIEARLSEMETAKPALDDCAVIEPAVLMVQALLGVIDALRDGIAALERAIEETAAAHPDYSIFASFPGAGPAMAPRLLAAFGSQRDRYQSASEIQALSGIAPVQESSGSQKWVHFRWACPKFLRQTFHEFAGLSIQRGGWPKEFYLAQKDNGKSHHAAVRSLAFKWIRILFRCWQSSTPYQAAVFEAARKRCMPPKQTQPVSGTRAAAGPPTNVDLNWACGSTVKYQFKTVAGLSKFLGVTS